MIDSEKETLIVGIILAAVALCILAICSCCRHWAESEQNEASKSKSNKGRQELKQLEMGALEIVKVSDKKYKRNINIDFKAQEYNTCADVSDASDDNYDNNDDNDYDKNFDNVITGIDEECVPIVNVNTMAPQAFGEESDPETIAMYDNNNIDFVNSNVADWSQSDVLKWLKSHLINNQIESNVTDIFIKEFETKYVTGKVLLQLAKDDKLFDCLKKEFSKTNQIFGIWVVFKSALESINHSN